MKNSASDTAVKNPEGSVAGSITATAHTPGHTSSEILQVVEFVLGKEHFAVDLFHVKEVVEFKTITKLPNSPSYVRGIIDLRGEITTIIDLKQRMNLRSDETIDENTTRIIVLDEKITTSKTGIQVDDVSSVSTFDMSQVDRTHASASEKDNSIIGIIKKKVRIRDKDINELIIWIDIRSLLEGTNATT